MKAVRTPCVEDLIDGIVPAILIFLSTELVHEVRLPGQHLFVPPVVIPRLVVHGHRASFLRYQLNKLIAILSPTRACYKLWVTQLP